MVAGLDALLDMPADMLRLGQDSSRVIGLRMVVAGRGGAPAEAEIHRMVSEKVSAALDAVFVMACSLLVGEGHLAAARALALYRNQVQVNYRRLTLEG